MAGELGVAPTHPLGSEAVTAVLCPSKNHSLLRDERLLFSTRAGLCNLGTTATRGRRRAAGSVLGGCPEHRGLWPSGVSATPHGKH